MEYVFMLLQFNSMQTILGRSSKTYQSPVYEGDTPHTRVWLSFSAKKVVIHYLIMSRRSLNCVCNKIRW